MKKILIATNILTLALLALIWSGGCRDVRDEKKAPPVVICNACTNTCYPYDTCTPFTGVHGNFAKDLIENYRIHQWASYTIPGPENAKDTRAVWFSMERLKEFIYATENSVCKHHSDSCSRQPELGIRIYFGTYPAYNAAAWGADGDLSTVLPAFAEHHTLMMVPTYYDQQLSADVDFDPFHWENGNCKPKRIDSVYSSMGFLLPTNYMNHGGPWPPPYDSRFNSNTVTMPNNINMTAVIQCNGARFAGVVDGLNAVNKACQ